MPLIPALGRQRQVDFWVQGQPGLQSEFQDSQGYTEKPCLKKKQNKTKQNKTKEAEAEAGGSLWVGGQSGLQSEFQDSHGYTEKPCLKQNKTKQNKTNKQTNKKPLY